MPKQSIRIVLMLAIVIPLSFWFATVNPASSSLMRIVFAGLFGAFIAIIASSVLLKIPALQDHVDEDDEA